MVAAGVEEATAAEAGGFIFERADAGDDSEAILAAIKVTPGDDSGGEGEVMAAGFVGDPEVDAGLFPFGAVRADAASSCAYLGEEMGEFMAESSIDFVGAEKEESRIEGDDCGGKLGGACGAAHLGIPADFKAISESGLTRFVEESFGDWFPIDFWGEWRGSLGGLRGDWRGLRVEVERQIELHERDKLSRKAWKSLGRLFWGKWGD